MPAKAIMIQGTMSNAGKSLLAAGLCRIFARRGLRCAPFKSQNMALNSFVTADGLEIGRAQAMQAEAAKTAPLVQMNPVLLKPTTHIGSQVIVNGEVRGDMRATEYFRHKKELIPEIMAAYQWLAERFDVIVIEGAGSPVELNLKADDIVNMGLAKLCRAPVLLVGDIDRGGIFPQLLGTLDLLEPDERAMVRGLVVNKFRGDRALFADGVAILEQRGRVPVAGVVPYMDVDLDEEDSLSDKLQHRRQGEIDIAVVRLPHISNYTDFDPFRRYEGVRVRYVARPEELGLPDLLILPGTKSTLADLRWLRETGMARKAVWLAEGGVPVFGICGGYQMLGDTIDDPEGAEGGGSGPGLGLLPMATRFRREKTRTQVVGQLEDWGAPFPGMEGAAFEGYEIHMGETRTHGQPLARFADGRPEGLRQGNVFGTYVHGLFDSDAVSGGIVRALCARRGLGCPAPALSRQAYRDQQYELLADTVEGNLNMELVFHTLEAGI